MRSKEIRLLVTALLVSCTLAACGGGGATPVGTLATAESLIPMGTAPTYSMSSVGIRAGAPAYVNRPAITRLIWAPGLDQGYDHQGLTYFDGTVYVSAYEYRTGACRVFAVSPADGTTTGYFDLPDSCHHAGGLTMMGKENGKDIIVVSDTWALYQIDLSKALQLKSAKSEALLSVVHLQNEGAVTLRGSFVDFDGTCLWIGTSEATNAANAMAYKLDPNIFTDYNGQTVNRSSKKGSARLVKSSVPIPFIGNGMAFDTKGALWITSSNSKNGIIYKLDPGKGCSAHVVPATSTEPANYYCLVPGTLSNPPHYNVPIGTEDLSFDETGRLWTLSEAGCMHWPGWRYSYPFVYQIDTSKLNE